MTSGDPCLGRQQKLRSQLRPWWPAFAWHVEVLIRNSSQTAENGGCCGRYKKRTLLWELGNRKSTSSGCFQWGNRRQWPLIVHLWTLQMVLVKSKVCEFLGRSFSGVALLIVSGTTSILLFCWGRFSTYPFDPAAPWGLVRVFAANVAARRCAGVQPPAIKPGNGSALFLVGKQRKLT